MSALVAFLSFIAVASPTAFRVTRGIFGGWIASPEGLATFQGLFIHAIVFMLCVCLLSVLFGKSSGYINEGGMMFTTRDDQDDQNIKHFQQNRFIVT
jgi:hypothetical protein